MLCKHVILVDTRFVYQNYVLMKCLSFKVFFPPVCLRPGLFQIKKLPSVFPSWLPFLFVCTCHSACEVRGQPAEVILFPPLYHAGSEDWTQVVRFGSQYLYWLNHLASYKTGYYYIAQVDLKFAILLFQPTERWDYKHAPRHPEIFYFLFEEENYMKQI